MLEYVVAGGILWFATKLLEKNPLDSKDIWAINEIFIEKKIKNSKDHYAQIYKVEEQACYKKYYVSLPVGKSSEDLDKCVAALETYFKNDVSICSTENDVYIKIYTTRLKSKYTYQTHQVEKTKGLSLVLGVTRSGILVQDLSVNPHLSVIGSTGSGKSVYVNSILCNLIENYTPQELELVLIDLKGNELNEYKNLMFTKYHTTSCQEATAYFKQIKIEMTERYKILGHHRSIQSYNKANPKNKMKYQFVVIEECYSLINNKEAWLLIADLLSKARACGVHFLLTTQRPTSDVIPPMVTTHLAIRVGLKTNKSRESENAIETKGLERLTVPGSGIININGSYERFQGFYIDDKKVAQITDKYRIKEAPSQKVAMDLSERPSLFI